MNCRCNVVYQCSTSISPRCVAAFSYSVNVDGMYVLINFFIVMVILYNMCFVPYYKICISLPLLSLSLSFTVHGGKVLIDISVFAFQVFICFNLLNTCNCCNLTLIYMKIVSWYNFFRPQSTQTKLKVINFIDIFCSQN